jgi:Tol biopolymer transport system component
MPVLLNGVMLGSGVEDDFAFSDSAAVVYRATQDAADILELYRAPSDGSSGSVRLLGPLVAGGDVTDFQVDPSGQEVVYRADQDADEVFELYRVPLAGGATTKLSGALVAGGDVLATTFGRRFFALSPDGTRVLYVADQLADNTFELFGAPVDGSAPAIRLNAPFPLGGDVGTLVPPAFSADGTRVAYLADQTTDEIVELLSVPGDGSAPPVSVSPALDIGPVVGDVTAFRVLPDGARALYVADQEVDERFELYGVTLTGARTVTKLSDPAAGDVLDDFQPTVDGARVVYRVLGPHGFFDLYSAPMDGGGAPVLLGGFAAGDGSVFRFTAAPNGSRAAFIAGDSVFSVPLDGSASPVLLSADILSGQDFEISPDGSRVVYATFVPGDPASTGLFVRPIDGTLAALKLSGTMVSGAGISDHWFAAGGTRVVFLADALVDNQVELFSVPLTGGTRVRLNATLPANADVRFDVAVSPDGMRVLYRADQEVRRQIGVYVAPVDGSQGPTKLNAALPAIVDVRPYPIFAPDSARVVFLAGALYSVPADASLAPVRISAPGDQFLQDIGFLGLRPALVDPLGARVVYVARPSGGAAFELFSTPLLGGGPVARLNPDFVAGGNVRYELMEEQFWITPERRVLFVADAVTDETFELYDAPLDGSRPAVRRSETLAPGGDVLSVESAGRSVVYRADQDSDEIFELFLDHLEPPRAATGAVIGSTVTRQL